MVLQITHTIECHCGGDAEMTTTHLDPMKGGRIVVDVDLTLGQSDFECPDCGCMTSTGDIDTVSDDSDCDGGDGDDD